MGLQQCSQNNSLSALGISHGTDRRRARSERAASSVRTTSPLRPTDYCPPNRRCRPRRRRPARAWIPRPFASRRRSPDGPARRSTSCRSVAIVLVLRRWPRARAARTSRTMLTPTRRSNRRVRVARDEGVGAEPALRRRDERPARAGAGWPSTLGAGLVVVGSGAGGAARATAARIDRGAAAARRAVRGRARARRLEGARLRDDRGGLRRQRRGPRGGARGACAGGPLRRAAAGAHRAPPTPAGAVPPRTSSARSAKPRPRPPCPGLLGAPCRRRRLTGRAGRPARRRPRVNSSVLVCGTRGYGPRPAALLGGVTRRVFAEARCPVVVLSGAPQTGLAALVRRPAAGPLAHAS